VFLAWQRVRGTNFREDHVHLDAALRKFITASGADPHEVKGFAPLASEDDLKAFHLGFLERNSSAMAVHMVDKRWLLFETDAQHPFWLSDNPVVLHNDEDLGPRGNIGLAVPGIQVYLPVSPTLLLGLLCFSQEAKIRAAEQVHASFCAEWRANGEYNPAVDEIIFENIARGAAPLLARHPERDRRWYPGLPHPGERHVSELTPGAVGRAIRVLGPR